MELKQASFSDRAWVLMDGQKKVGWITSWLNSGLFKAKRYEGHSLVRVINPDHVIGMWPSLDAAAEAIQESTK